MKNTDLMQMELENLLTNDASIENFHQIAASYCSQNSFEQALSIYQRATVYFPDCAELYREMGVIQEKLEDIKGEVESYRKAISLDKNQPFWLYATLADLLGRQGEMKAAITLYNQGFERYPNDSDGISYARFALLLSKEGKTESAINAYKRGLELQPELAWIKDCIGTLHYNQGVKFLLSGNFEVAETCFKKVEQVKVSQEAINWFEQDNSVWPWAPFDLTIKLENSKPENLDWPRISVVTPSLNQGQFIEETILSVINQEYPNLEYIVVDGGSTDTTQSIIERYQEKITVSLIEPDLGQSNAINKGFRLATGDLLTWLNSDDMLAPGALHRAALEYLKSQCDVVAGICIAHQASKAEMVRKAVITQENFTPQYLSSFSRWEAGEFFFQPEVIFSRKIWEQCGGQLNEEIHYAMDHELWLRFSAKKGKLQIINWPIGLFRKHLHQKTDDKAATIKDLLKVFDSFLDSDLDDAPNKLIEEGRMKENMKVSHVSEYLELIEKYFEDKKWHELIDTCNEAIDFYPEDANLFRWRGFAQEKTGDPSNQLLNYKKSIELDSNQPVWVYIVLARLFFEAREWGDSIKVLDKALSKYPSNAEIHVLMGLNQEKFRNDMKQAEHYYKAISLDSNQPTWLYTVLLRLLRSLGKYDESLVAFAKARGTKDFSLPEDASIFYEVAQTHLELNQVDKAVKFYESALKIKPDLIAKQTFLDRIQEYQNKDQQRTVGQLVSSEANKSENSSNSDSTIDRNQSQVNKNAVYVERVKQLEQLTEMLKNKEQEILELKNTMKELNYKSASLILRNHKYQKELESILSKDREISTS